MHGPFVGGGVENVGGDVGDVVGDFPFPLSFLGTLDFDLPFGAFVDFSFKVLLRGSALFEARPRSLDLWLFLKDSLVWIVEGLLLSSIETACTKRFQ